MQKGPARTVPLPYYFVNQTMTEVHRWLIHLLQTLVVISLCGMSVLTVVDASGRYFLNAPVAGTVELIELLMIFVIFASIPVVTFQRSHVNVDLLDGTLPPKITAIQLRIAELVSAFISALLAYATWKKAVSVVEYGDTTPMWSIPLAPFLFTMVGLLTLDALLHARAVFVAPDKNVIKKTML